MPSYKIGGAFGFSPPDFKTPNSVLRTTYILIPNDLFAIFSSMLLRFVQKLLFSSFLLAGPVVSLAQITVAIGDFENQTGRVFLDAWERKIPEFLGSELSRVDGTRSNDARPDGTRSDGIIVVERQRLKQVLDEQALGLSGLIDSSKVQEVGRMLSVQYFISGSIHRNGEWLRIDARIIQTETAKTIGEKVQCRDETRLDQMVALLGNNLRYQLTGKGNYRQSVTLKKYPTRYFLLASLGGTLATVWVQQAYLDKHRAYRNATQLNEFDPLYQSANRLHKTRTAFAVFTGAGLLGSAYCWMRNLNPDRIVAFDPAVLPTFAGLAPGDFVFGIRIRL